MKKKRDSDAARQLVITARIFEIEWKALTEEQGRTIVEQGISHSQLLDLLDSGDGDGGPTTDLKVWFEDEEIVVDDCLCSDPETRVIGGQEQWMLVRREWHKGSAGITLAGEFEKAKLTFSTQVIALSGKTQPEAVLLTAFYDGQELDRLGSDCKSGEWILVDPDGQEHEFEVLWDEVGLQAALSV